MMVYYFYYRIGGSLRQTPSHNSSVQYMNVSNKSMVEIADAASFLLHFETSSHRLVKNMNFISVYEQVQDKTIIKL